MQIVYACAGKQSSKIMKKTNKKMLTKKTSKATVRRMPLEMSSARRHNYLKNKALKRKRLSFIKRYQRFFVPPQPTLWQEDDDNSSLEQPSPLKWVPSETTYGIGVR
jgi:hypothetical protein